MASVVLASSKNITVSNPSFAFFLASSLALVTSLTISFSVTPPWTYYITMTCSFIYTYPCTFIITNVSLSEFKDKRSHMYLINLVFPQPVSPINTTGMLHLHYKNINVIQMLWYRSEVISHSLALFLLNSWSLSLFTWQFHAQVCTKLARAEDSVEAQITSLKYRFTSLDKGLSESLIWAHLAWVKLACLSNFL